MRSIYKNRTRNKNRKTSKTKRRIKRSKYSKKKRYSKKKVGGSLAPNQNIGLEYTDILPSSEIKEELASKKDFIITQCANPLYADNPLPSSECPSDPFYILCIFGFNNDANDRNKYYKENFVLKLFRSSLSHPYGTVDGDTYEQYKKNEKYGNMVHFALQQKIEQQKIENNFYISKIFAHGVLKAYPGAETKLVDSYLSEITNADRFGGDHQSTKLELVEDLPFSIIERPKGGYLSDLILSNTIKSLKHKLIILKQLAIALNFIHESGYIYFNLNPQNIELKKEYSKDEEPQIRLKDFGMLYNTKGGQTFPEKRVIPEFKAPEYEKSSIGSNMCDVWSFGVLALQLFLDRETKKESYETYVKREAFNSYLEETEFEENSPELHIAILINCCLQNDPKKRLSFIEILNGKKTTEKYDGVFKVNTKKNIQIGKKTTIKGLLKILEEIDNPAE